MNSKELFIKCYNAQLDFNRSEDALLTVGIRMNESLFSDAFYTLFDGVISQLLTEEGLAYFYDEILFENYSSDEAVEALEEYFI